MWCSVRPLKGFRRAGIFLRISQFTIRASWSIFNGSVVSGIKSLRSRQQAPRPHKPDAHDRHGNDGNHHQADSHHHDRKSRRHTLIGVGEKEQNQEHETESEVCAGAAKTMRTHFDVVVEHTGIEIGKDVQRGGYMQQGLCLASVVNNLFSPRNDELPNENWELVCNAIGAGSTESFIASMRHGDGVISWCVIFWKIDVSVK